MALVPLVTAAYVRKEHEQVKRQLNDVFQILLFLTIPACIGIGLLARPLFTVFSKQAMLVRHYYNFRRHSRFFFTFQCHSSRFTGD